MDDEQKYKEALAKTAGWYDNTMLRDDVKQSINKCLQEIFPELKESADERIRKALIFYFGHMPEDADIVDGITYRDILVWLEKQKVAE